MTQCSLRCKFETLKTIIDGVADKMCVHIHVPHSHHLDTSKSIEKPTPKPDDPVGDEKFWLKALRIDIAQITHILQAERKPPNPHPQPELEKGIHCLLDYINKLEMIAES